MIAHAFAETLIGLEGHLVRVEVEVEARPGEARFDVVGLGEASIRESGVRVRSALSQVGVDLAGKAIKVTLTPTDLPKSGGGFDVAIAAATLAALGRIPADALDGTLLLGELALTGAVRPVRGVLPALRWAAAAGGIRRAVVPRDNGREAAAVGGVEVGIADRLAQVLDHFAKGAPLDGPGAAPFVPDLAFGGMDLAEVRGQPEARRALEIAAAGGHNLILEAPPGAGKTMLARRLHTLLPPMSFDEALEVTAIHSVAGLLNSERGIVASRPFRAPHHNASEAGVVGGGSPVRPGEVTLAHRGVLFLDEMVEVKPSVLQALRRALVDGFVTLAWAGRRVTYPARPLVVGAINPCPCGYAGMPGTRCDCPPERVRAYRARLDPLRDCFDLHVVVPPVDVAELRGLPRGETSAAVRARVIAARQIQEERARPDPAMPLSNGRLAAGTLGRVPPLTAEGTRLLASAVDSLGLSVVARARALRVARTLADLDASEALHASHVSEALYLVGGTLPPVSRSAPPPGPGSRRGSPSRRAPTRPVASSFAGVAAALGSLATGAGATAASPAAEPSFAAVAAALDEVRATTAAAGSWEQDAEDSAAARTRLRQAETAVAAAQAAAPPGPKAAYVYYTDDTTELVPIVARAGVLVARKKGSVYTLMHEPTGLDFAAPEREVVKTVGRARELLERAVRPEVMAALDAALASGSASEKVEQFYAAWQAAPEAPQAASAKSARRSASASRGGRSFAAAAAALASFSTGPAASAASPSGDVPPKKR